MNILNRHKNKIRILYSRIKKSRKRRDRRAVKLIYDIHINYDTLSQFNVRKS
jgi:hypothetical protein